MRPLVLLPIAVLSLGPGGGAWAQTVPQTAPQTAPQAAPSVRPARPWTPADTHHYPLDRHRHGLEVHRARAAEQQALARQIELDRRLAILELQAQRTPPLDIDQPRRLGTVAEERTARQAATRRRETVQAGTGQIDAWLDRRD